MKSNNNKLGLKALLILIAFLMLLNFVISFIKNREKKANIYNVQSKVSIPITYSGKGTFVFDEYVIDAFENTEQKIDSSKIYRNDEKVIDKLSPEVNRRLKEQNDFLNALASNKKTHERPFLISNIYNDDIYKIDYNYTDSINEKEKYKEKEIEFFENLKDKNAIIASKSGFYTSDIDGYESLLNKNNISNHTTDIFIAKYPEQKNSLKGLKYISNKSYDVILKINNFEKYNKVPFNKIKVVYDKDEYLVSNYNIHKNKNDETYIQLTLNEGLSEVFSKREANVKIIFNELNTFKVPHRAIVNMDGQDGVYTIDSGIIEFAPVKVVYTDKDYSYLHTNKESVFPKSYLDLVEENNNNLANDVNDKDYIKIVEINEFSNILLNTDNIKVGDRY